VSELRSGVYVPADAPKMLVGAALAVAVALTAGEGVVVPPPHALATRTTKLAAATATDRRSDELLSTTVPLTQLGSWKRFRASLAAG
jgi:hypothetical protein